ncbi:type ISP restriction/modification enzyme [Aquaspirillum soli]
MPRTVAANADRIRQIKTFPSLVEYLGDELNWPIKVDDFDDLTYEWGPEELGIDKASAAKINELKQLRPLADDQPWGIFFVKFEPKQLPVVALRRLLNSMVIRKRESANKSERQAWAMNDLIFISSYGDSGERHISFAHFSQPEGKNDLPTLRVLGWDNSDAPLHLDLVATKLAECLSWPDDKKDIEGWRNTWQSAFTLRHRETINTAKDLSIRLAALARAIRDRITTALAIETDKGPLTKLMKAFQSALMHDLDEAGFADMYAQTIAYGLLSARIADPKSRTADDLTAHMKTNPFLKELMQTFLHVGGRKGKAGGPGIDFDELGVSEVVELLDDTNMEAVILDFGDKKRDEDPVMHFFEGFLTAYDKDIKKDRGVFYTPQPVVSYIVRSVHELLQTEFGLVDGLADITTWGEMLKKHPGMKLPPLTDEPGERRTIPPEEPFVQILDPATGTATFLVEVIDVIHATLKAKWKQQRMTEAQQIKAWNDYVPKHLLPRLHAYELMMAPYAIAHMKVGLKLAETGYGFGSEERARIYLTNALEPWHKQLQLPELGALAHEAAAVNEIKRQKRFTVVIGNPPYSGHSRNNKIHWIVNLVKDFTRDEPSLQGPGQGKWLQDDYVKFLRLSQYILSPTDAGILAMITNHRYLTNRTFKGMRRLWRSQFPLARILDLHGNRVVHELSPIGIDENVFDIEQGVAIGMFAKGCRASSDSKFHELWGSRTTEDHTGKYDVLARTSLKTTSWQQLTPAAPDWLYSPRDEVADDIRSEFESAMKMLELMPGALGPNGKPQSGLLTMHDGFALSFTANEVEEKIRQFLKTKSRDEAKQIFGTLCNPQQWDYAAAKVTLASPAWRKKVSRICSSPFDTRYTVYDKSVAVHLRRRLSDQFFNRKNLGLVLGEAGQEISGDEWDAVSCVSSILQLNYFRRNGSPTLPLYIFDEDLLGTETDGRRPNLSHRHLAKLAGRLGLKVGKDGLPVGLTPEHIFYYVYAVFHSPNYRSRYAEFLKIDFPRLPLTGTLELFHALAKLGGELTALHLLESPKLDRSITEFIGSRNPEVEKASWSKNTVWVDKAQSIGFKGVPEEVWNFHIGGYQVCEKWLKDRKGRTLSKDDIAHYQKIVVALTETTRLMAEIDKVIDKHGGWPGAFK